MLNRSDSFNGLWISETKRKKGFWVLVESLVFMNCLDRETQECPFSKGVLGTFMMDGYSTWANDLDVIHL